MSSDGLSNEKPIIQFKGVTKEYGESSSNKIKFYLDRLKNFQFDLKKVDNAKPFVALDDVTFDIYQGDGIENNKKSIAFLILIQDTYKTLEDKEVSKVVDQVINCLENKFGAKLR